MRKKITLKFVTGKIMALVMLTALLSACTMPDIGRGSSYVKADNYYLYIPAAAGDTDHDLIYVVTVDGTEKQAEEAIAGWQQTANKHQFMIAVPLDWDEEVFVNTLKEIRGKYGIRRVYATGLSHGGYVSCGLASAHPELIDGVIPMASYCDDGDFQEEDPATTPKLPILVVVGENDAWARGAESDDIERASDRLNKIGISQEIVIVPGLGHAFPKQSLEQVAAWMEKQ
jgi:predicted esterase